MDNEKLENLEGIFDPSYYSEKYWKNKTTFRILEIGLDNSNRDSTYHDVQNSYLPIFVVFK